MPKSQLLMKAGVSLAIAATLPWGCREAPKRAAASVKSQLHPATVAPNQSPVQVAKKLGELHQRGDYAGVASLIVEHSRDKTVATLRTIDEVLAINEKIVIIARDRFIEPLEAAWSLGFMRHRLGLFSTETTFINQTFVGEDAVVTFQEGDSIPLSTARFTVNAEGAWRYCPDDSPANFHDAMALLKSRLSEILAELSRGLTFEQYSDAFYQRIVPCLRGAVGTQATVATVSEDDALK